MHSDSDICHTACSKPKPWKVLHEEWKRQKDRNNEILLVFNSLEKKLDQGIDEHCFIKS